MRILLAAIYPYTFLLLYLIIPFDDYIRALPNVLVAILVIAFPFIVKKEDFKKMKSLPIALFLGLIVFLCIDAFFNGRFQEDFNIIKKVMIAGGLVILYVPINDAKKINGAIIFSALAAVVFSVYNFVIITDATESFAIGKSPQVVESLLVDRLYLGLLCTFSILISVQAIHKKYHPNNNYYLANIIINLLFIIVIASKIAVISLFILMLIRQFYGKQKIWKAIIALGSIVVVVVLFFLLKNEKDFQGEITETRKTPPAFIENTMTYELRALVWNCSKDIISEERFSLLGIGFDGTKDKLVACYEYEISNSAKKERFISERYNTHNQFLDFYISAGFIALLFFLSFITISFISIRKQFFTTAMLALLVMYCSVENVFHRQIGAYYIGFILIVIIISAKREETTK